MYVMEQISIHDNDYDLIDDDKASECMMLHISIEKSPWGL